MVFKKIEEVIPPPISPRNSPGKYLKSDILEKSDTINTSLQLNKLSLADVIYENVEAEETIEKEKSGARRFPLLDIKNLKLKTGRPQSKCCHGGDELSYVIDRSPTETKTKTEVLETLGLTNPSYSDITQLALMGDTGDGKDIKNQVNYCRRESGICLLADDQTESVKTRSLPPGHDDFTGRKHSM